MNQTSQATSPGSEAPRDLFVTTRWTVIVAAGGGATPEAEAALQELCRTYWYPLYAYVRRQGWNREDSEDLTQAFFAKTLANTDLSALDSEKGRFRAFLLASLKHFLANEWDKLRAQKRGGGQVLLPLDWQSADTLYSITPADNLSPDKLYDRAWAITLLERVITRLRAECVAEGKEEMFDHLKDFLMLEKNAISYEQVAASLKVTEGAARVTVHRLRKRYRELLRDEVAQTLLDGAQVEDEMRALFLAFSS